MTSAPPIGFDYRPSWWLGGMLLSVGLLAMLSVFVAALPDWIRALLLVAIAVGLGRSLSRLLRPRVLGLVWQSDGALQLRLRGARAETARLCLGELAAGHVLGPVITLKLRWTGRVRATLWLLPDNLDDDTRRRLRVRLRAGQSRRTPQA